jgi:magnesium-transporting ATPase (P-type)
MKESNFSILHDHYKESFSYIREREKRRDRLFLILILIYELLAFQIQYPLNFKGAVNEISILSVKLNLDSLPLAVFLSSTWIFILTILLRYCQASICIERQYLYLHKLEDAISVNFGDDNIYRREGKYHTDNYPLFLNWIWIYYTILIPIILIIATAYLFSKELKVLRLPIYHKVFDMFLAFSAIITILLYIFSPIVIRFLKKNDRKQ